MYPGRMAYLGNHPLTIALDEGLGSMEIEEGLALALYLHQSLRPMLAQMIDRARDLGFTWEEIGAALGTTKQGALNRRRNLSLDPEIPGGQARALFEGLLYQEEYKSKGQGQGTP